MESIGRFFVGLGPDREARHRLAALIADGGLDIPGRVVPPENWHLTLRFLGQVEAVQYERLLGSLDQADLGGAFSITLSDLGAFPKASRARVLWVGVKRGNGRLADLAATVEAASVSASFSQEERPFHAHLTLSRMQPPHSVAGLLESRPELTVSWTVDEVAVYESHLGRGGARYEIEETFPLE